MTRPSSHSSPSPPASREPRAASTSAGGLAALRRRGHRRRRSSGERSQHGGREPSCSGARPRPSSTRRALWPRHRPDRRSPLAHALADSVGREQEREQARHGSLRWRGGLVARRRASDEPPSSASTAAATCRGLVWPSRVSRSKRVRLAGRQTHLPSTRSVRGGSPSDRAMCDGRWCWRGLRQKCTPGGGRNGSLAWARACVCLLRTAWRAGASPSRAGGSNSVGGPTEVGAGPRPSLTALTEAGSIHFLHKFSFHPYSN